MKIELTIEQQFRLKVCAEQAQQLSPEAARMMVVELMRQNMVKDNAIRDLLRVSK
ncbi:MAG: NblA/ycf18 family protein [Oscillatoriaceae cyanobacterium Prado104]|jgi:hypothetical protein|nr:NblA/ycf18 family protein [Oscillatoriaceae cyanobacterium Prado104]